MTVPVLDTVEALQAFMLGTLGKTGTVLNLSAESFENAAVDAVILYGVPDLSLATDMPKLRACARYQAWKRAWAEAASDFDFSADGRSYKRSQRFGHIDRMLGEALEDLATHGVSTGGTLEIYPMDHPVTGYRKVSPATEFS